MKPKKIDKPRRGTNLKQLNYFVKDVRRENETRIIEENNEINEAINNFMKGRRL